MSATLHGLPIVTSRVNSPEDAVRILNRLQPALQVLSRTVNYGPVHGAYFPFAFGVDHATALGTGTAQDGIPSIVEFRPIALAVWVDTGEVTIDINADGSSILTAPLATSSSVATLTDRVDFDAEKVDRGVTLSLDIDSIDSGTPTKLRVSLWVSQMGDIFDV